MSTIRKRRDASFGTVMGKEYSCGIFEIQGQYEAAAGCSHCQVVSVLCVPVFPPVK